MSSLKLLEEQNFDSTIASKGKILIDFYADWCGPCKMMTPILEALAQEMAGKLTIYKLDVDTAQKVSAKFDITSVPTLILFDGGVEKKRIIGLKDLQTMRSLVS